MEKPFKNYKCKLSIEVAEGGESKSSVQHRFAFWILLKVKSRDITVSAPWIAAAAALGYLIDSEEADQDGPVWLHSLTLCQGQVFTLTGDSAVPTAFFFFFFKLAVLGLRYSRCGEWDDSFIAMHGILTVEACCRAQALSTLGL